VPTRPARRSRVRHVSRVARATARRGSAAHRRDGGGQGPTARGRRSTAGGDRWRPVATGGDRWTSAAPAHPGRLLPASDRTPRRAASE